MLLDQGSYSGSHLCSAALQEREEDLAAQAHACREYARVNAIAMRKVLELHDQLLGSSTGHQLLQVRHTHMRGSA